MNLTADLVWNNCLSFIEENITPQAFKTWFEPIKAVKLTNSALSIQVPSKFFYEWLEEHYVHLLKVCIAQELGDDAKLVYVIRMENDSSDKKSFTEIIPSTNRTPVNSQEVDVPIKSKNPELKNPFVIPGIRNVKIESRLNINYNFENFLEGDSNRLARSAGMAVANKPGKTSFNPLLIFGDFGLGKTHLVHAIGVRIKDNFPEKKVLYISAEKFTQQYIESVKKNNRNDFILFYQIIDVLIVDDIQLLSGKAGTQDVFFYVLNELHQNEKQVILTSDKAPVDMQDIEQRLLSHFKWGLSAELHQPDFETRVSIIRNKLYRDGVEMPEDVIVFLANNIKTNLRELEGVIISLIAHSSFKKEDITLDLAKSIINLYDSDKKKIYKDKIKIHDLLKNAFIKYLVNFDEYVKDTKGIIIEFHAKKTIDGIELEISIDKEVDIEDVRSYINEYVNLVHNANLSLKDKIIINELTKEIEFLEIKYNSQISQFKTDLNFANYKVKYLEEDISKFKNLFFISQKEPLSINLNVNQTQDQKQVQEQTQSIKFSNQNIIDIQDAFDFIKNGLKGTELFEEAEKFQEELDSVDETNIEELKKGSFKNRFRRFFSKIKQGVDGVNWTRKTAETFIKGKESLQKLAEYLGVEIKDIMEIIEKAIQ
ncbi:chromosomal replication initiator protein DnaA [Aquimarina macrocephali]|nr:chromosomal replication initiator protein DnaA [Aquimarina macrocephali]